MLTKRIIACLDVRGGRNVKGVNFENLRDVGDPVELGRLYAEEGIDELVFLDITATIEKRRCLINLVGRVAAEINIPFTVGGGISRLQDVEDLLAVGADKVSINSAAVRDPGLIESLAKEFGSQRIVVAVDVKQVDGSWQVYINSGQNAAGREALAWARQAQDLGAGEILLTSMDHDGTKDGYAIEITRALSDKLEIPVVASGGAGCMEHFKEVFLDGHADAALAASIFHFGEVAIRDLKVYLNEAGIPVKL
ncbi:MAG: imidazole glycerol phosphate synthase subunit HisF [Deltaproteobacteria bacterium]|nr:imidazole glycerol phosphate synthase subunit HisF [Deltaproteobacteria bacterium]